MTPSEVNPSPSGVPGAVTDPGSVHAEELVYPGAGGTQVNGYIVRPTAPGALPGMIVIHEAGGLNAHVRDVANRIAGLGYVALAVDLYTREGGPPPSGDVEALMQRLFSMSDATVLGDLEGAADLLLARDDVTERVGCIGFCMGGRYTLLFACQSDRLSVAVDCWGGFIDRATPEQRSTPERPTPPIEMADRLHCPLFAALGAEDQNPSPTLGADLLRTASGSGKDVVVGVFAEASHAFFADYRPTYRPRAAAALWRQIVPFLAGELQGD